MTDADLDARLAQARGRVLRRIHRRRRIAASAVVGAGLLVAGSGVGATIVVQRMTAEEAATSVVCFAHDDLGSLNGTVAMGTPAPSPGARRPAPERVDKRELCGLVWNSGLATAAADPGHHWPDVDPNVPGNFPTPPLAFCLLNNGETAGFPIEAPSTTAVQVCDRLGLPADPTA